MLRLDFHIKPGKDGVYDGVELAEQLLRDAVSALLPYADRCPHVLGKLLAKVAGDVLDEFEAQKRYGKFPVGFVIATGDDLKEKMARIEAHLNARRLALAESLSMDSSRAERALLEFVKRRSDKK